MSCTLLIVFPTYNRGKLFVNDIQELLNVSDSRFRVYVNDNDSNDGSCEDLNKINDYRFYLSKNDSNIGGIANMYKALCADIDAEYVLFCLDKDKINVSCLSKFIDLLERVTPLSGYIDLYNSNSNLLYIEKDAGFDALKATAYKSKHPSGFFWKKSLLQKFLNNMDPKIYASFPFWMDVLQAHFASMYNSIVVYIPLILHAPFRKEYMINRPKTLTYNQSNIYFSYQNRVNAYLLYLSDLKTLPIDTQNRIKMSYQMLLDVLFYVTVGAKKAYADKGNCWHYNVEPRKISFGECLKNMFSTDVLFWQRTGWISSLNKILMICISNFRVLLSIIKTYI